MVQNKKKSAIIWEYKVGNNANIANSVFVKNSISLCVSFKRNIKTIQHLSFSVWSDLKFVKLVKGKNAKGISESTSSLFLYRRYF